MPRITPPLMVPVLIGVLASACGGTGQVAPKQVAYELLEDRAGRASIDDVAMPPWSSRFHSPPDVIANLGLTPSVWWLRFSVGEAAEGGSRLLELQWPLVDAATLYSRNETGGFTEQRAGRRVPIDEWATPHRLPTFRLPAHGATHYLRVASRESLVLPLVIWSEPAFGASRIREASVLGFYFGMLFVMTASGVLVYLFLRDFGFLSYAGLVGTFALWQASFEGLFSTFVWPDAWWWTARALHVFGILCVTNGLVFARTFLSTAVYAPGLDRAGSLGLPVFGLLLAWALIAPSAALVQAAAVASMLVGIWVIIAGVQVARQGYRFARYFLASWSLAVVAALVQALRNLGVLPSNVLTDYGMQVGISVTFVTLALGLIDRILEMRDDLDRRAGDVRRLEREDAAKRTLLATASHDLRQPLHAVGLLLGALRDRLGDAPSRSLVEKIQSATLEMGEMFNGLLDVSRLDAGMIAPTVSSVDVKALVGRLDGEFQVLAKQKGLVLRTRTNATSVRTDPVLLSRILRNLLSNALRYTATGEVRLETRLVGDDVEIVVADTGRGIPDALQEGAFDAYRRLEGAREAAPAGMGLGLSIVRRLVDLLGHELRLESEPEHGTTVTLRVPRGEDLAASPGDRTAGTAERGLEGLSVLVVDDDPAVRDGMMEQLGSWGCVVRLAASADEAMRASGAGNALDVVLADYHLGPGPTGVDVVGQLRRSFDREIPAVIITGDSSVVLPPGEEVGSLLLLRKPVKPARLRTVLNRLARERRTKR